MKRSLLAGSVVAILGVAALSPAAFAAPPAGPKVPAGPGKDHWKPAGATAVAPVHQSAVQQGVGQRIQVAHLAPQLYRAAGVPGATAREYATAPRRADGTVEVTVTGQAAVAAAKALRGRVLAISGSATTVVVASSALRQLAASTGVDYVQPARRAIVLADSEGVAKSGAAAWRSSMVPGSDGAGMKIGIVDAGFGDLTGQQLAGNLPTGLPPGPAITLTDRCSEPPTSQSQHGTAVAEIVHQMAPKADLFLYCVDDNLGFDNAGTDAINAGLDVVSSSLGFPADGRGDGTGINSPGWKSSALTVKRARQAGILWVQSAGNSAQDHWSGTLADTSPHDGYVDLFGSKGDFDSFLMLPNTAGTVALSWDRWTGSPLAVTMQVDEFDHLGNYLGTTNVTTNPGAPTVNAPIRTLDVVNTAADQHQFVVSIRVPTGTPAVRFDLSYLGDVSPSYRAFPTAPYWGGTAADGDPARAAANSVSEPASSPYAFGVGAVYQGDNTLEDYSSRGPTIDGRIKPDILGFDGTTSNLSEFSTGFFGTSAAAPHVAGAAALVKAASIAAGTPMDASQTQAFLDARATPNSNPATNAAGHGVLYLGQPTGIAPDEGSLFTPMDPIRVLETRPAYGGAGIIQPNHEVTVTPPPAVPSDATAVMINLTGVGATGPAFLSAYPNSYSGVSNVDLSKTDPTLAVAATVALNANHQFKVRASVTALNALVDVVGYYRPASAASGTGFQALTPTRILDTRYATGGHQRPVLNNEQMTIHATGGASGVPITATAVVFNLTAVNMSGPGYLSAFPTTFKNTSTLDYGKYTMANLATVQLASGPSPAAGTFQLLNRGPAVNAIIDVVGYFDASAPGQFHVLPSPVRIADTRTGNGGRYGALAGSGPNATLTLDAAGVGEVPLAASAVWVGVIAVPTSIGYLTVYPAGQNKPLASTVDFTSGRAIANAAVTGLGSRDFSITESGGGTHAVADLFGYFK